jgi:hypothetical protein
MFTCFFTSPPDSCRNHFAVNSVIFWLLSFHHSIETNSRSRWISESTGISSVQKAFKKKLKGVSAYKPELALQAPAFTRKTRACQTRLHNSYGSLGEFIDKHGLEKYNNPLRL